MEQEPQEEENPKADEGVDETPTEQDAEQADSENLEEERTESGEEIEGDKSAGGG